MKAALSTIAMCSAAAVLSLAHLACSRDRTTDLGASGAGVHPTGIADPTSPAWHGALLRAKRWAPMLDGNDPEACGRCHDGTPARPDTVLFSAPGATACTECHTAPQGVLACGTCHGTDRTLSGAHAAHIEPSPARATGLPCSSCHPTPSADIISGLHGNGSVEVIFDPAIVTPEASYSAVTSACAVSCHDRGGVRPKPVWSDPVAMRCGDCHGSPPASHFPGPCTTCHIESNAGGTALTSGPLHLDGRIDLGNGNGTCGACHGTGSDPWPTSAAHKAHESPTITLPVDCASCHTVPANVLASAHLDGIVEVQFTGRAIDRGARPVWDGQSCSAVACHGAKLVDPGAAPVWADTSGAASACGACHGIPPTQHTPSTACGRSTCHGAEIAPAIATGIPFVTAAGLSVHINGTVDFVH